jgi:hypothetical protein
MTSFLPVAMTGKDAYPTQTAYPKREQVHKTKQVGSDNLDHNVCKE